MSNISYNWGRISVIDSKSLDTNTNLKHIIKKLWFTRTATDSLTNNTLNTGGLLELPPPDPSNYMNINNITRDQLIIWIETKLGQEKLQQLDLELYNKLQKLNTADKSEFIEKLKNMPTIEEPVVEENRVQNPPEELSIQEPPVLEEFIGEPISQEIAEEESTNNNSG